jgi:hypothetical protein
MTSIAPSHHGAPASDFIGRPNPAPNLNPYEPQATPNAPTGQKTTNGANVKRFVYKIRAEFILNKNGTFQAQPKIRELLTKIKEKEPTMNIIGLNDTDLIVDEIKNLPTDATEIQKFILYERFAPPNSGIKDNIIARIETSRPFYEIKAELMDYLGKNRIFVRPHDWQCNKVKSIGFVTNYSPTLFWREDGKEKMDSDLKKANDTPEKATKIPTYKIVKMPKGFGNDENRVHTQVGEIHCAAEDAKELMKLFTSKEYTKNGEFRFIPEGVLQIHGPIVYKNILIAHNKYLNDIRTIPIEFMNEMALNNLLNDDMQTIKDILINGTNGQMKASKIRIHRTTQTPISGRWLIACTTANLDKVRSHILYVLTTVFPTMMKENGNNDTSTYYFNNQAPNLAGRPAVDSEMYHCFQNIAAEFANPQTGEDDVNLEFQAQKKRRSESSSYADVANLSYGYGKQNNGNRSTGYAKQNNNENTLTAADIQGLISSQLAKEFAAQELRNKSTISEQNEAFNKKLHILADEQTEKSRLAFVDYNHFFSKTLNERLDNFTTNLDKTIMGICTDFKDENTRLKREMNEQMKRELQAMEERFYPRVHTKNRTDGSMEIDAITQPTPAEPRGHAANDTRMSLSSTQE